MIEGLRLLWVAARAELGDEVTAEDIADAAWLARWRVPADRATAPEPSVDPPELLEQPEPLPDAHEPKPDAPQTDPGAADGPLDPARAAPVGATLAAATGTGETAGRAFGAQGAPALTHPLALARALRPLARRVPSRTRFTLDIDATIDRFADERVLVPVLRRAPERWLRLVLVADGGVGGDLWWDLVREFGSVLGNMGAFRDVRVWALDADGPNPRVAPLGDASGRATRDPDELTDPLGRTVTVVMSPFVAPGWRDGSVAMVLNRWAACSAVVLVPLLPERLWLRTALGAATPVRVSSSGSGVANARLRYTRLRPLIRVRERRRSGAPVADREPQPVAFPIALLEPEVLRDWAAVLVGSPDAVVPGVLYPSLPPAPDADQRKPDPPTAEERVRQFRLTTSKLGQRLAGLIAAAPVSLKLIGLIRTTLLPEAGLDHEAEVLFGGLLERTSKHGESDPRFEFYPGVRELLLDAAPPEKSFEVFLQFGGDHSLAVALADQTGSEGLISAQDGPIGRIAAEVLLRLGGAYAKLVRDNQTGHRPQPHVGHAARLAEAIPPEPEPVGAGAAGPTETTTGHAPPPPSEVSLPPAESLITDQVDELARRLTDTTDEAQTVELLTRAAELRNPRLAAVVVPRLAARWPEPVRQAARAAFKALGVEATFDRIAELAGRNDPALDEVLDGLAVLQPREDLIELLSRVAERATGAAQEKAAALRDHKRLGLNLTALTKKFKEATSSLELKRLVGQGRLTDSYLARDDYLRLDLIVRVLREEFARIPDVQRQFLDVHRQSVKLAHPNLVRTLRAGSLPGTDVCFSVRAFVDGTTLRSALTRPAPDAPAPRFRPAQVVEILRQLLNVLEMMAERVLYHGNVQPANIYLTAGNRVVLGDRSPPPFPSAGAGASPYWAPEVLRDGTIGPAADLYSLGCVGYELCCGQPPFPAPDLLRLVEAHRTGSFTPPSALRPELGPDLDAFLARLLDRTPAARGTATEALRALDALPFTDGDTDSPRRGSV